MASQNYVNGRELRVLHCIHNVGGHPSSLAQAERRLGIDSRCFVLEQEYFSYPTDRVMTPPGASILRKELARLAVLYKAITWADIVHFNFGTSILAADTAKSTETVLRGQPLPKKIFRGLRRLTSGRDATLLAQLGKGLVVTYQGDDVRPSTNRRAFEIHDTDQDRRKELHAHRLTANAIAVFALNPDLLNYLPNQAAFMPYANVDPMTLTPAVRSRGGPLVVAHAPTNRSTKGTDAIVNAVRQLQQSGHQIELDLIENVPNHVVLQRVARCDVVVDQLRIGWYGGFAVEAMSLAKPVVTYLHPEDLAAVPSAFRDSLPLICSDERRIEETLKTLLWKSEGQLFELGQLSRAFVVDHHSPTIVARQSKKAYEAHRNWPNKGESRHNRSQAKDTSSNDMP